MNFKLRMIDLYDLHWFKLRISDIKKYKTYKLRISDIKKYKAYKFAKINKDSGQKWKLIN